MCFFLSSPALFSSSFYRTSYLLFIPFVPSSLSLTFRYVAPEILLGEPYGTEVDIWSMGVICYVLLAGYPPFYDEDQKKLFKKIKEGKYHFHQDYWCNTSPDAMDMIKKMLCVNQVDR